MLIPALFVADAIRSRLPQSANRYDVIIFSQRSEVGDLHLQWMAERGIEFRDDLDISDLMGLKKFSGRLTEATLMKLRLPQLLAGQYDRILYLDCDLTIYDDVGAIFSVDTGPFELGAVPSGRFLHELTDQARKETYDHFKAIGMTEPYRFFNAGVLYIDVAKWNASRLGERAIEYFRDNPELCQLPDEHALNAVLDGQFAELTLIWNMRPSRLRRAGHPFSRPVIVHHVGEDKPWRRYGYHKRLFPDLTAYRLYEAFLRGTPWNGWLDEQWNGKDFRDTIVWEIRRVSRRLRGKLNEPSAAQTLAAMEAARRYYMEGRFADIEQGIVDRGGGVLRLKTRAVSQRPAE